MTRSERQPRPEPDDAEEPPADELDDWLADTFPASDPISIETPER